MTIPRTDTPRPIIPSPAIEATHLTFGFDTGPDVLHDVSAVVPVGATCALLGPNGAGKSTLLELMAGLRRPRRGTLRVHGTATADASNGAHTDIALVTIRALPPVGFTTTSLLRYVSAWQPRWDPATADALLERFALAGRQRIDTLSFGNRMKVQLLCALAARPRLLLLDEPFTGLDVATKDALVDGLLLADDPVPRTTIIASHDLAEMELLVDHLIVLADGRVRLTGNLDALREQQAHPTTLRELYVAHTDSTHAHMESAA
jgi:ABC-2 type transport system ATP-binding protein